MLSFFFVALFMLLLAGFSIYNLNRLNAGALTILNDYQSALTDTAGIVSNSLMHSLKVEQYVTTGNPAHLRAVEDLQNKVALYLTDLQKKTIEAQEIALVQKIEEAYQTYLSLSIDLQEYYRNQPNDKASLAGRQMKISALLENALLSDSTALYEVKKLKTGLLVKANHRLYYTFLWFTVISGGLFTLVIFFIGFSIVHSISTPISKLVTATRELASGNLSARPPMKSTDEIGILAESFTAMADQLQDLVTTLENRVTERTQELLEEQKFVSAVLDTTHALVVVFDLQGRMIRFNQACKDLTGYAFDEVKNKPVWEVLMLPEHAVAYKTGIETFIRNRQINSFENHWLTKKGALRLISWFHTALVDRQGAIAYVVATGMDITERRNMEQELFKARKLESIGVLAGGIAHDFSNLLTSIHGEIELAQMYTHKETKPYQNLVHAIESCKRARDLIWQFITISKGGAPQKKEGLLLPLIREVCDKRLTGSNIHCETSQTENLWPVAFDRPQLEQVIQILVENAKEAMPEEGMIRIWIENVFIHDEKPNFILKEGGYIRIAIQDQGRGIPEKHLPLLFDPYFSTKERGSQKGMGLGLTTAYSIIKKHSGHIDLASKVGIGTIFYVYLPAEKWE